jgi:hypothetical protein
MEKLRVRHSMAMKTLRRISEEDLIHIMSFVVMLSSVITIVGIVGYDIYQHPADPRFVHSATVKISGTGHFQGDVGTPFNAYTVEGDVRNTH